MAVSVDLGSALDQAYEDKASGDPRRTPSAPAGLTERHNQMLSDVFGNSDSRRSGKQRVLRSRRSARRARQKDLVPARAH